VCTFFRSYVNWTDWWNQSSCHILYSHDTLTIYKKLNTTELITKCIMNYNENQLITYIAVFRHPLEKIISQLYFFSTELSKEIISHSSSTMASNSLSAHDINISKLVMDKLIKNSLSITPNEMTALFDIMDKLYDNQNCDLQLHEYQNTLDSKIYARNHIEKSYESMNDIVTRMGDSMLHVVGITEYMPSFFILLFHELDISLEYINTTCKLHYTHGASKMYQNIFNNQKRPTVNKILRNSTIDVISERYKNEFVLYDSMIQIHKNQLLKYHLTIEEATSMWNKICE
jgi:hypothetical protein